METDDVTTEDLLDELNQLAPQYSPQQEGDVTTTDVMISRELCRPTATAFMKRMVKMYPERYKMVKVQWGESNGARWQWALRHV
jgi:hypothetical protein